MLKQILSTALLGVMVMAIGFGEASVMTASAATAKKRELSEDLRPTRPTRAVPRPRATTLLTPAYYVNMMTNNAVRAATFLNGGWAWGNGDLARLTSGATQNDFFTVTGGTLKIKTGVRPSAALKDIFYNKDAYGFDCASAAALIIQAARLLTIGDDDFDRLYLNNSFKVAGWSDGAWTSNFSMKFAGRTYASNGAAKIGGVSVLKGELMPFDPAKGDTVTIGGLYYFEKPGDNTTADQGWNVIYLGMTNDGKHAFWRSPNGIGYAELDPKNNYMDTSGEFPGMYLSSSINIPEGSVLASQDKDGKTNW